jgi:hypothetical protein
MHYPPSPGDEWSAHFIAFAFFSFRLKEIKYQEVKVSLQHFKGKWHQNLVL